MKLSAEERKALRVVQALFERAGIYTIELHSSGNYDVNGEGYNQDLVKAVEELSEE